jgi:hypothetical protein
MSLLCARHGAPMTRTYLTCVHVLAGAAITFYEPDRPVDGRSIGRARGEALCRLCTGRLRSVDVRIVCARCVAALRPQQLVQ